MKYHLKEIVYKRILNMLADMYTNCGCSESEKEHISKAAHQIREACKAGKRFEETVTFLNSISLTPYAPNISRKAV